MNFFILGQNEEKSRFIQPFICHLLLVELVLNYCLLSDQPVLDRNNKVPASVELQADGTLR